MQPRRFNRSVFLQFIAFLCLIVLSVVFFRERLLADSGYYLFRMINSGIPRVEHERFILVFAQFLPWLAVLLSLPLKTVLLLYSLNHVLFPFLIFLVSVFYFKNVNAGIFLILLQVAGIAEGFMVPAFELYYAASLAVLLALILFHGKKSVYTRLLSVLLAFLIISSHPVGIVLLLLICCFYAIDYKAGGNWFYIQTAVVFTLFLILKYYTASDYESGKAGAILQALKDGTYTLAFFGNLALFLLRNYLALLVFVVVVTIRMIRLQWYTKVVVYLVFVAGTLVLSALNTGNFELSRYNEQVWFPLVFVTAWPLMYGLADGLRRGTVISATLVLMLFAAYRFGLITKRCMYYRQRTALIARLIEQVKDQKSTRFVVDEYNISDPLTPGANWSFPIESMFFSAESGPENTITICTLEDYTYHDLYRQVTDSSYIFWRINTEPYSWLNPRYFRLTPEPYINLNRDSDRFPLTDSIIGKVRLIADRKSPPGVRPGSVFRAWIRVQTRNDVTLFSNRKNGLYLTYQINNQDVIPTLHTPLSMDIQGRVRQDVLVRAPESPGVYMLKILLKDHSGKTVAEGAVTELSITRTFCIGGLCE